MYTKRQTYDKKNFQKSTVSKKEDFGYFKVAKQEKRKENLKTEKIMIFYHKNIIYYCLCIL